MAGFEALISHTATGIGFSSEFARGLRGWSEQQWADGFDRLRSRSLVDRDGELTEAGTQLRSHIADLTDELAYAPWTVLCDDDREELTAVAQSIREAVLSVKLFPSGAFGARYGQPR